MKKIRDHYFEQARREGFAARSAYKLVEIDRKQRLLRRGWRVLDLGCAPGSWLQVAAERVGPHGRVVGVDLRAVTVALPSHVRVLQGDAFALSPEALLEAVSPDNAAPQGAPDSAGPEGPPDGKAADPASAGTAPKGARFDLVLSDMAPNTSGIPSADAARSAEMALRALVLAEAVLRPGGDLLVKVFQGARLPELRRAFAAVFERVSLEKPTASRSESVEIFLLARGLRRPCIPLELPKGKPKAGSEARRAGRRAANGPDAMPVPEAE